MLIPNDREELIFDESVSVMDNNIIVSVKGIPSYTMEQGDYCYFEVENGHKLLSSKLNIDIAKDDYENIDHKCAPQFIYDAQFGSISENPSDAFAEFFEGVDLEFSLEEIATYKNTDECKEVLKCGMGNYVTKKINGENYIVFGMFHED